MPERLDWFPCNPAKLLGALASMRAPEGYVYTIVLLRIYESGGACRDTIDAISVRTKLNKRVVSEALDSLFRAGRLVRDGDGIMNPVAETVIAESKALREKRKSVGTEAANRRWEKEKQKQQKVDAVPTAKPVPIDAHLQLQEQDSLFSDENRAPLKTESKSAPKPPKQLSALEIARKEYFDRGKVVLGDGAGGMLQRLLAAKHGNVALGRAAVEQASTMDNPRQYVGGILKGAENAENRNNGGQKLGYAGIAQRVRRASTERADGASAFFDAGDHEPGDRHRSAPIPMGGLEGGRQAAEAPPRFERR